MEEYREFEAKTVDEAIVAAMRAFRSDFESLDIQVVSEGSKGLFGLVGTKSAKILARPAVKDEPEEGMTERHISQARPEEVKKEEEKRAPVMKREVPAQVQPVSRETLEKARQIVTDLLDLMNMTSEVRILEDNLIEITGDGSGLLIGKRGTTIDSLQFITNRIINKNREEPIYITIDTEGYRQRHMNHLKSMAMKMGQRVKRTGQSVSLEKMNPYDRRIIHLALKNDTRVNTKSVGEGIYKKVVILPGKASR
ncbi:KH domain-containing protein [archaeon]|nr:KH domain-containing protein [archaeon]